MNLLLNLWLKLTLTHTIKAKTCRSYTYRPQPCRRCEVTYQEGRSIFCFIIHSSNMKYIFCFLIESKFLSWTQTKTVCPLKRILKSSLLIWCARGNNHVDFISRGQTLDADIFFTLTRGTKPCHLTTPVVCTHIQVLVEILESVVISVSPWIG